MLPILSTILAFAGIAFHKINEINYPIPYTSIEIAKMRQNYPNDELKVQTLINERYQEAYNSLKEDFNFQQQKTGISRISINNQTGTSVWKSLVSKFWNSKRNLELMFTSHRMDREEWSNLASFGLNSTTFLYGIAAVGGFKYFFTKRAQQQYPTYFQPSPPIYYEPPQPQPLPQCCPTHS